jgi:hypothetical protein
MAKLEIHPNDLAAVLKSYPETEVELLNKTTAAIAETIARRVTNEQVQAHVDRCVGDLVQQATGYNTKKLAEPFAGLIHTEAKRAVNEAFGNGVSQAIRQLLAQELQNQMPGLMLQVSKELKKKIKEAMKEHLVELLLSK